MLTKSKVRQGLKWSAIQTGVLQLVNFATLFLLAWGIPPSYHALVTIGALAGTFVSVLGSFGIQEKIIVDNQIDDRAFSTYFWFSIFAGVALSLISFLLNLMVSWIYSNNYDPTDLVLVGGLLSITPLLGGINGFFESNYARRLKFATVAKVNVFSTITTAVIAIGAMLLGFHKSALVLRLLSGHMILTLSYFVILERRIPFHIDWELLRRMKSFSSFLTLNSVANYIVRNIDYIIIGKFFSADILGQYTIAYKLLLFPLKTISGKIYSVMLPILSQNLAYPAKFKRLYFSMTGAIALGVFPLCGLLALTAWFWVPVLFPSNYLYLESMIVILSIVAAVQALVVPVGSLFLLTQAAKKMFLNSVLVAALMGLSFGISCLFGDIYKVLIAYAAIWIGVVFPMTVSAAFSLFEFRFSDLFKSSRFSLYGLTAATVPALIVNASGLEDIVRALLSCMLFIVVFVSVYYFTSRRDAEHRLPRYWHFIKG